MKVFANKKIVFITAAVLLLAVAAGTVLAFVFTDTPSVKNTFAPSVVACAVVEKNGTPVTDSVMDTGNVKENVQIQNTGDTDAYIRVAVVVNWCSQDGTKVWAQKPVAGTDYTITYAENSGWDLETTDGYFYYTEKVAPTELTGVLISRATQNVKGPVGIDGTQYYLSIEIVASAIQATPTTTVAEQWGVTVAADATIGK